MEGAGTPGKGQDRSAERLLELAARGEVHDERQWMAVAQATGAKGNTSCLVGTAEQVAEAILRYYRPGVASFLISGIEPVADVRSEGRRVGKRGVGTGKTGG